MDKVLVKRGEIYMADLDPVFGSEQGSIRPVLIIQNDKGNQYSPTTVVLPLTTKVHKSSVMPTHKYDLTQHPNYNQTADYDKKNLFDVEKYLHRKIRLKPDDMFEVINMD